MTAQGELARLAFRVLLRQLEILGSGEELADAKDDQLLSVPLSSHALEELFDRLERAEADASIPADQRRFGGHAIQFYKVKANIGWGGRHSVNLLLLAPKADLPMLTQLLAISSQE